mmetsp:Transcript_116355/g.324207  ORF Transcript_116355/g.324207 Transcript_116355/m.324207 type:complete len:256 (+) Transcript_116355:724-1491(+)
MSILEGVASVWAAEARGDLLAFFPHALALRVVVGVAAATPIAGHNGRPRMHVALRGGVRLVAVEVLDVRRCHLHESRGERQLLETVASAILVDEVGKLNRVGHGRAAVAAVPTAPATALTASGLTPIGADWLLLVHPASGAIALARPIRTIRGVIGAPGLGCSAGRAKHRCPRACRRHCNLHPSQRRRICTHLLLAAGNASGRPAQCSRTRGISGLAGSTPSHKRNEQCNPAQGHGLRERARRDKKQRDTDAGCA